MIIKKLKKIQAKFGYLPREELVALSEKEQAPIYELYGLVTFFPHFRTEPPPTNEINVCADLMCHLKGASKIIHSLEKAADQEGLEDIVICKGPCLGRCDEAIAVSVNGRVLSEINARKTRGLIKKLIRGKGSPNQRLKNAPPSPSISPYTNLSNYDALRNVLHERSPKNVIESVISSEIRGMGGAGFPTGLKWKFVNEASGKPKYVICNADESEPGTFKDRYLLQTYPELIIEGILIAGYCVGATKGIIFVRHEYYREAKLLAREITRARKLKAIGTKVFGSQFNFHLEIFESPGGYICGEETALLEVLEGKRAEPRNKPPFPGVQGLFGKPTLINNVETFAFIPAILARGAEWFKSKGRSPGSGLKFFSLTGDVNLPGVYEAPMGISVKELIEEYGGGMKDGKKLKAFLPGGASSGFLPSDMVNISLDFKSLKDIGSMLGTGAVVAIAEGRCMLDLALNLSQFFKSESCGKCVPCRIGSSKIVDLLIRFTHGQGNIEDLAFIEEMSQAMLETSICGLGQAAPNPIHSVIRFFKDELVGHFTKKQCPAKICQL